MNECSSGGFLERTGCILDYGGSVLDVGINYALFFINLAVSFSAIQLHTRDIERASKLRNFAIGSLISVIVFQISLCLILGCMGISIVWCAMGGWIISERRRLEESSDAELNRLRQRSMAMERFVILVDVIGIGYYAVTQTAITTIAHVCALILGAVLSSISIKLYDGQSEPVIETTTPSTPLVEKS